MKDPRIGRRVKSLNDLVSLGRKHKSVVLVRVWHPGIGWSERIGSPTPAAFMANRIGTDLARILNDGLHVYNPPVKFKGIRKGFKKGGEA
jgi:hypothetical protein